MNRTLNRTLVLAAAISLALAACKKEEAPAVTTPAPAAAPRAPIRC
jgi:nitrous oxide reductase accessory protein NosL